MNSGVGVGSTGSDAITDHRANALFGNGVNYSGGATPGPGYVTDAPRLDSGSPPSPMPDASLVGAAEPTLAPLLDYFGAERTALPDIGCVESSAAGR